MLLDHSHAQDGMDEEAGEEEKEAVSLSPHLADASDRGVCGVDAGADGAEGCRRPSSRG